MSSIEQIITRMNADDASTLLRFINDMKKIITERNKQIKKLRKERARLRALSIVKQAHSTPAPRTFPF